MSPFIDNNSCMKFSVATSTADIADDDVTELVVVLRGTLGRLDVFDGATVVMRFWEELSYVTYSPLHIVSFIGHGPMALWGY